MIREFGRRFCKSLPFALVAGLGLMTSGCSTVPDWVDPTTWIGGESAPAQAGQNEQAPDLASLPEKPAASSTPDDQKQVAESLATDNQRSQYSAEALRGGSEAAAPPPAATPEQPSAVVADTGKAPQAANAAPPAESTQAPAESQTAAVPPPAPTTTTEVAAATSTSGPAVPALSAMASSDTSLGFKPSNAPPLDASVAQFVPAPILERYRETAAMAGVAAPIRTASARSSSKSRRHRHSHDSDESALGGPETMGGAVVANLDAIQGSSVSAVSYASPQGAMPSAIVFFPGDGTRLGAEARAKVRSIVEQFRTSGGQGSIRVVGHSSSRTGNMAVERHLMTIFEKSQSRANAVASELIREGVPANKVLIEAVGDSQPVYYESMPKGEDGNRRAEIFLQG